MAKWQDGWFKVIQWSYELFHSRQRFLLLNIKLLLNFIKINFKCLLASIWRSKIRYKDIAQTVLQNDIHITLISSSLVLALPSAFNSKHQQGYRNPNFERILSPIYHSVTLNQSSQAPSQCQQHLNLPAIWPLFTYIDQSINHADTLTHGHYVGAHNNVNWFRTWLVSKTITSLFPVQRNQTSH